LGGATSSQNLAWACLGCNGRKHTKIADIDPLTGEKAALFNPRQQDWHAHFAWDADATQILGRTSCGRATIRALVLNRPGFINLRRLLAAAGLHPPD
jgi:hypothetical protein